MSKSRYHIDGYLTDYECAADSGIRDVQVFKETIQGYEGPGVVKDEWGKPVFKTLGELGLKDHPKARFQPNGEWTELLPEADWPAMKTYIETKGLPRVMEDKARRKLMSQASRKPTWPKNRTGRYEISISGVRVEISRVGPTIRYYDTGTTAPAEVSGVAIDGWTTKGEFQDASITNLELATILTRPRPKSSAKKKSADPIQIDPQETLSSRDESILNAWRSYSGPIRPRDGLPRIKDYQGLPGLRSHAINPSIKLKDLRRLKPHL